MNKDLEQLSALYDGELSLEEIHEGLKKMNEDPRMKNSEKIFKGIIFKRSPQQS